jgi:amino acid transporter
MANAVLKTAGESIDSPAAGFQRRLGPFDATMLVAGSMIGSGIFIVSADICRDVGSAGGLLAVWLVTGLLTVCGALSYGELAAMMPRAGGQYVYLREAYSPFWGFLYGWTLFLVIQTGTIAAVGVAFAKFLGVLVPALGTGDNAILFRTPFHLYLTLPLPWLQEPLVVLDRTEFTVTGGQLIGAALVAFLTWLNCRGVQEGKIVQNVFTVAKTLALIVVIGVGLTVAANPDVIQANLNALWNTPATKSQLGVESLTGVGSMLGWLMVAGGAMVGSLFSSDAWNNVTFAAGEVRNPRRTLPLSLICGTGLVTTLYLLANVAYLAALPVNGDSDKAHYLMALSRGRRALVNERDAEANLLAARVARLKEGATPEDMQEGNEAPESTRKTEIDDLEKQAQNAAATAERSRIQATRRTEEDYAEATRALGISQARDDRVGTAVMQLAFSGYGAPLMAIAIMVSTFGCLNGLILAGARLYWAMARDGLFFRSTGTLNARGVPAAGLVLQGFWSVLLIFTGTYGDLLDYVIFAALLFYVLTVSGLFVLRYRRPDAERPYRALGYPILPLLYVLVSAAIMVDLLIVRPRYTWPGLAIVLTGVPAYFVWRMVGRPAPVSSVES